MKNNLTYGISNQLVFSSTSEFFESIGLLCKPGIVSIYHEDNDEQGAWGKEERIHVLKDPNKFTDALKAKFTKGRGSVLYRINCNEFIQELIDNYGFSYGTIQSPASIRAIVLANYPALVVDFDRGYNR